VAHADPKFVAEAVIGLIVGRILLFGLGAVYWSYAVWPRLPIIRSLPYFWRGNLPPAPEWRILSALFGSGFIVLAVLIGPPFMR
jgi:hypothetical protein